MSACYIEIDPFAAQWLRNLIEAGLIAPGIVLEKDIRDIAPSDLAPFVQVHAFAGIGVWSAALGAALAGPRRRYERHISYLRRCAAAGAEWKGWTGSCPCQPFSGAGKGGGFDDERHLWPAFHWLIEQCRPDVVLGEQVEGPAGRAWLDLVSTDLEGTGYAFGAAVFPAAGVGAPHIRHRTYWLANAVQPGRPERWSGAGDRQASGGGVPDGLAHADGRNASAERVQRGREQRQQPQDGLVGLMAYAARAIRLCLGDGLGAPGDCGLGPLGHADRSGREACDIQPLAARARPECLEQSGPLGGLGGMSDAADAGLIGRRPSEAGDARSAPRIELERLRDASDRPGPTNGFWRDADWLGCRDGKWRPVEPGTFPLAHGAPARVGRLRAYGNAICLPQAQAFIEAVMGIT